MSMAPSTRPAVISTEGPSHHRTNGAVNRANEWKRLGSKSSNRALNNAQRLQSTGRRNEYGPQIAEAYSEATLTKYTRMEIVATSVCLFGMVTTGILGLSNTNFFVATLVSAWLATVAYRGYRHHMKCLMYLRAHGPRVCPHCGKTIGTMSLVAEPSASVR